MYFWMCDCFNVSLLPFLWSRRRVREEGRTWKEVGILLKNGRNWFTGICWHSTVWMWLFHFVFWRLTMENVCFELCFAQRTFCWMPYFLLQVIRISETTDETFDALFQFSKELGKVPVACRVSFLLQCKLWSLLTIQCKWNLQSWELLKWYKGKACKIQTLMVLEPWALQCCAVLILHQEFYLATAQ